MARQSGGARRVAGVPGPRLGVPTATTSGTTITLAGIPSGTRFVVFGFSGVSTDGVAILQLRLNTEATGYVGATGSSAGTSAWSTGILLAGSSNLAAANWNGSVTLSLLNAATNNWIAQLGDGRETTVAYAAGGGSKSLSDELTQVQLYAAGDAFDAGEINILDLK